MDARHIAAVCIAFAMFLGCSGGPTNWNPDTGDDASSNDTDSAAPGDDGGTTQTDATAPAKDSGTTQDASTTKDSGTPKDSGTVIDSGDGFGAARTACINEINKLRATEGHSAYTLWTGSSIDSCVDEQATNDQTDNSPHEAWINNKYPTCNGYGQDECLGYGITPSGVVACLDDMWNEKYQSNCSGCSKCQKQMTQNCANCDFYGQYGQECGHYVNMSADYFSYAACGFSTLGGSGQWAVQNFK
jgi:hypothetical protein